MEEARAIVADLPDQKPQHIGDLIDAENVRENEDQELEGATADEQYAARIPELSDMPEDSIAHPAHSIYRRIGISNVDAMLDSARNLAPEQRQAFDEFVGYCKNLRKSVTNGGK